MLELISLLLSRLQGSALGEVVRNAEYLYPVLEASHILGIALLVGPAFTFDLRLLGVGHRAVSVTAAARTLLRIAHIGFAIALLTGIALLSAQAVVVADTGAAPWKFGFLILALLNVLVFHGGIYRHIYEWADAAVPPVAVRVGACVSLLSWTGVIFSGRLLAYT